MIVTRPLAELDSSIRALGKNKYQAPKLSRFAGSEIKRLVADYQDMSKALLEYQHELEDKVEARTTELSRISKLDPLTELYNRRGFEVHMVEYMQQWHEQKQPFGLINIDVNKFKAINDLYGHGVGDFVLKKIAAHLVDVVGQKGEVSRWGGDEFLILLKQIDDLDTGKISAILLENKKPLMIKINNQDVLIEFSVGSTLVQEGDTLEDMLHRADKAMYVVKFADR